MYVKRIGIPFIAVIAVVALAFVAAWLTLGNDAKAQANLPPPANVQVVNGDNSGEVVVSWDAVEGASGYTIQWVNNDAARNALHSGQDWRNLIRSVDVDGGDTATHTVTVSNPTNSAVKYHFRVGSKSGPDAEPASWPAWQSLNVRGDVSQDAQGDVSQDAQDGANQDVQALAAAMSISRHAGELVALSGTTTPGMTVDGINQSATAIAVHKTALAAQLEILSETAYDARTGEIARLVDALESDVDLIQQGRRPLWTLLVAGIGNRRSVTLDSAITIVPAAEIRLDEEFYSLVDDSDNVSIDDLLRYSHLKNLVATLDLATPVLLGASTQDNPALAGQLHELFDGRAGAADRDIEYLREIGAPELEEALDLIQEMFDRGRGDDNLWDGLYYRLGLITQERVLVAKVANTQQLLLHEIDRLAAEVLGSPQPSAMPRATLGEPGITDDEIKFGQSAVLTGPSAALGEGMRLGIRAAFHEANQAGGVNGRELTLNTINDYYELFFAFSATSQLIGKERVFGMVGSVGTPTTRAALPAVEASHVPFVGAFTGAQLIRRADQTNVLNLRASYHDETETMVARLQEAGVTKVAVLYQNDSYGQDGLAGVKNALAMRDGMDLVTSWYYTRNTTAVKAAAYRIAQAEPEAVIIIGAYAPTAAFIKETRARLADDPIFMAVSFVGANALKDRLMELEESVSDVYVTQVVPLPGDASNAAVAAYLDALSAYDADAEPGFVSLEGYLAGRLAIERLEACGAEVTRECFLDVFGESTTISIAEGFELEFGPGDNQGSDDVFLTAINSDGEYELVDGIEATP